MPFARIAKDRGYAALGREPVDQVVGDVLNMSPFGRHFAALAHASLGYQTRLGSKTAPKGHC
jgi:hypothetical protein